MTPAGRAQLANDEGLRLVAYPDPISRGEPWTIGRGHTGADVHPGLTWTAGHAEVVFAEDIAKTEASMDRVLGDWWRALDAVRQDVLVNMAFNLGVKGLSGFQDMLTACRTGRYGAAALEMAGSAWAHQVPARANRLIAEMRGAPTQIAEAWANAATKKALQA